MKLCLLANARSIHTRRWASHLSRRGHDVTVLSLSEGEIPGATVRRVGPEPGTCGRLAYLFAVIPVRRTLKALKPDVVHAHYAGGYGFLGALAGWHPLIISAWGSDVLVVPGAEPFMKWVITRCLGQADLITSVATHMSASIRALGVTGRILTLPFGVDTDLFRPANGANGKLEAAPLIVSTRHLEPIYNVGLLIEALPEILSAFPSATVAILGDGSLRQELERRVRELGVERSVSFTGRVTEREIARYLSKAAICVSTSLSDGNNISLNEAMACGAFPVVTDIPANREWIENGRGGFLVDTKDPRDLANRVVEALRSPNVMSAAAELNWEVVRNRASWQASMTRVESEYCLVAQKYSHGANSLTA